MKVLTKVARIEKEVMRLIKKCESCEIAVAWATVGFKACKCLMEHRDKIKRMVVGTHFYQTNPAFMEEFLDDEKVHFIMPPHSSDVFHPKIYLFDMGDGCWECIIGSPNFTTGGFHKNEEAAILFTSDDEGAEEAFTDINSALTEYWEKASAISVGDLEIYKESYNQKRPHWNKLKDKNGDPFDEGDDTGKEPSDFVTMTWRNFFAKVKTEKIHSLKDRLEVISAVQQLFNDPEYPHFINITKTGQKQIAGLVGDQEGVNFGCFGSMIGSGVFKSAIKRHELCIHISDGLDLIPDSGSISKEMYLAYIERFEKGFSKRMYRLATASRLLAMKRPDVFVCVNSGNMKRLCKGFGIKQSHVKKDYETYWDLIIEQIMASAWWLEPEPETGDECDVWNARAAFLDAICIKNFG